MEQWKLPPLNNREKVDWGKKGTDSFRDLRDYNKSSNVCVIRILEGEEKEGRVKKVLDVMAEHFLNLIKDVNLQIQEA